MPFPLTLAAMEKDGYKRKNYSRCEGCRASIEWWTTPKGSNLPMEPMPYPESAAISHWARCPKHELFRKEPTCTTDDSPEQPLLFAPPQFAVKHTEKKG